MRRNATPEAHEIGQRRISRKPPFEHPEDRQYFKELLCRKGEALATYGHLFDFRPPNAKRAEFKKNREKLLSQLMRRYGSVCQLHFQNICDHRTGMEVDHLIPLSSNKLNKELRHLRAPGGRKVPPQSLGSNNLNNLVIACRKCNGPKKHRFLSRVEMQRILRAKGM